MEYLGWLLVGLIIGGAAAYMLLRFKTNHFSSCGANESIVTLLASHFKPVSTENVTLSERNFPFRVRADLQRAIDILFVDETKVLHFCGVRKEFSHEEMSLTDCLVPSAHYPTVSVPPEYEELDIGDASPIRVLKIGLWLLEKRGTRFAVLLTPKGRYGQMTGIQFQVATPNSPEGTRAY